MKKQVLFTILLLLPLVASAYDVKIDGIYYDLKGGIAMVTYGDWNNDPYSASPKKGDGRYEGKVVIPESITYNGNSYKVTIIGDAFKLCPYLTSITIPPTVTKIGDFFCTGGVSNLKEVHISDLAAWCSVSITNTSPLSYAHHLYLNNKEVKELVIPNSVTSIGDRAFSGYSGLTSVTIPNSVTSIGEGAFDNCTSLASVTIGNSVTSIKNGTFQGCTGLTSVTIGNSVTSIGDCAFFGCTNLASINIPNSVTSIGVGAFYNCTELTSIVLPNTINYIGMDNFSHSGLTSIEFPSSMSFIRQICNDCKNLKTIIIPSSFYEIGGVSFENCPKIEDVYCYAEVVPNTDDNLAFRNSYIEYASLHVPASAIEAYKSTAPWNGFGTIVALSEPEKEKCATPTIAYKDGKLSFGCETEGVSFYYCVTPPSSFQGEGNEVSLSNKYTISVYAKKEGYENSETVTKEIDVQGMNGSQDVNGDGIVDTQDVLEIYKYIQEH